MGGSKVCGEHGIALGGGGGWKEVGGGVPSLFVVLLLEGMWMKGFAFFVS